MEFMDKKKRIRIKEALATAFYEKEKVKVGEGWHDQVMSHIRRMGLSYPKQSFLDYFQPFVWRLAPVVFVLILLLGSAIFQLKLSPDYDLVKMFTEDPADFGLATLSLQ